MEHPLEPGALKTQHPVPDVVLEVGRQRFHVHRRALAAHSRYFEALFYGGAKESSQRHIVLSGVDVAAFQVLLGFVQSSRVALTRDNVAGVLETADFLQFQRVKQLCMKFLEKELHISNCLGMMSYAQQYACLELYDSALNVALTHFEDLTSQEDWGLLKHPKETLTRLLVSDELFVAREDVVFDAVLMWIMEDADREEDLFDLMGLVRVPFLSLSFLNVLIKRSQRAGQHDTYARLVKKLDSGPAVGPGGGDPVSCTSRSYETLYVLGGKHDKEQQELFQLHPKTGTWQPCSPLQRKNLTQYAVAAVGNLLFVTGGHFRGDFVWYSVDWVLIYNCWDNQWMDGPPMKQSRDCHCAVGVGIHLYVLGGSTDSGVITDVERLALTDLQWESTNPMVHPVERAAAVGLGTKLYVLCGRDDQGDVYGGVQRLDLETDAWDVVSFSPLPRYDLCATVLNGAIYTIGGQTFRFDVDTDEWSQVDEECLNRKFFMACTTANGRVYVLGQSRGSVAEADPSMVLFDPYIDLCQVADASIPCPLPVRGCVTVRRFDAW
ncbi:kelch-like protein 24a [Ambystoma mexicanum]|uniref:kelch-like protein 24a n=1 Tax=Ambystoma mexicanum TaxID=8296 RepID=UPI0037E92E20